MEPNHEDLRQYAIDRRDWFEICEEAEDRYWEEEREFYPKDRE